jgi:uncharacterized protein
VVFAREPLLGRVKTRLAKKVGDETALALHRAFVDDTVALARGVAERTVLAVAGDPESFAHLDVERIAQADGDLGARMDHAITSQLAHGPVCIIGSDSPALPRSDLERAFAELKRHDVVIGPSSDGGYWLIGARVPVPELFAQMAWGTAGVFAETAGRLRERNAARLPIHYDVDEPQDLERLITDLQSLPDTVAPATRTCLRERFVLGWAT